MYANDCKGTKSEFNSEFNKHRQYMERKELADEVRPMLLKHTSYFIHVMCESYLCFRH